MFYFERVFRIHLEKPRLQLETRVWNDEDLGHRQGTYLQTGTSLRHRIKILM